MLFLDAADLHLTTGSVPTRSPDVQMSVQNVSTLQGALPEVCLGHGAQVLPCQPLERGADVR